MLKDNEYFLQMKKAACGFEEERERWKARWGKPGCESDSEPNFPFTVGQIDAYRAWMTSVSNNLEELEMNDCLYGREMGNFVQTLRDASIKTFVYTNQEGDPITNIYDFVAEGCAISGVCIITRHRSNPFSSDHFKEVKGIRFIL